jgi:hypothetical protein
MFVGDVVVGDSVVEGYDMGVLVCGRVDDEAEDMASEDVTRRFVDANTRPRFNVSPLLGDDEVVDNCGADEREEEFGDGDNDDVSSDEDWVVGEVDVGDEVEGTASECAAGDIVDVVDEFGPNETTTDAVRRVDETTVFTGDKGAVARVNVGAGPDTRCHPPLLATTPAPPP